MVIWSVQERQDLRTGPPAAVVPRAKVVHFPGTRVAAIERARAPIKSATPFGASSSGASKEPRSYSKASAFPESTAPAALRVRRAIVSPHRASTLAGHELRPEAGYLSVPDIIRQDSLSRGDDSAILQDLRGAIDALAPSVEDLSTVS
jgi:hypothetical protein